MCLTADHVGHKLSIVGKSSMIASVESSFWGNLLIYSWPTSV